MGKDRVVKYKGLNTASKEFASKSDYHNAFDSIRKPLQHAMDLKRKETFGSDAKLITHFEKHGGEFKAKSAKDYLEIAHNVIKTGIQISYEYRGETQTGYVN